MNEFFSNISSESLRQNMRLPHSTPRCQPTPPLIVRPPRRESLARRVSTNRLCPPQLRPSQKEPLVEKKSVKPNLLTRAPSNHWQAQGYITNLVIHISSVSSFLPHSVASIPAEQCCKRAEAKAWGGRAGWRWRRRTSWSRRSWRRPRWTSR